MDDLISRLVALEAIRNCTDIFVNNLPTMIDKVDAQEALLEVPSAQPEITDEQAIKHLQESGWMQAHDKQMYEMGLREQLADDSDSYDALLPSVQPEPKWIDVKNQLPKPNEYEDGVHKYYLIQNEFGDMMVAAYWGNKFGHTWWEQMYAYKPIEDKVIAYMFLPHPYERSEE